MKPCFAYAQRFRWIVIVYLFVAPINLRASWFSRKPSEKDVSSAVLSGRGDDVKFMMHQHNINPSSVKTEKSSVDGVWKVSYEVKDPVTGKSTRYVSDVTTYERKKGKGVGLHFVNTEEVKDAPPISYEEHKIYNEGTGDVGYAEQATRKVCGFSFGENYLNLGTPSKMWRNARVTKLGKAFRYLTHVELLHGEYFGRDMLDTIILYGDAPDTMTAKEREEEVDAMAKILGGKYGVKMEGKYGSKSFTRYDSWKRKDFTNFEISVFDMSIPRPGPVIDFRHEFRVRIVNHYPMRMIDEVQNPKVEKRKFSVNEGVEAL